MCSPQQKNNFQKADKRRQKRVSDASVHEEFIPNLKRHSDLTTQYQINELETHLLWALPSHHHPSGHIIIIIFISAHCLPGVLIVLLGNCPHGRTSTSLRVGKGDATFAIQMRTALREVGEATFVSKRTRLSSPSSPAAAQLVKMKSLLSLLNYTWSSQKLEQRETKQATPRLFTHVPLLLLVHLITH